MTIDFNAPPPRNLQGEPDPEWVAYWQQQLPQLYQEVYGEPPPQFADPDYQAATAWQLAKTLREEALKEIKDQAVYSSWCEPIRFLLKLYRPDTPVGVLADWLREQGHVEQAELVLTAERRWDNDSSMTAVDLTEKVIADVYGWTTRTRVC